MRIVIAVVLMAAGLGGAWGQGASPIGESRSLLALHSPATAAGVDRIERYLFTESALSGRVAGLLALITAREMNLAYEWSIREDAARASGLELAVIDVVRRNEAVDGLSRDDALLIDFGRQLFRNRHVRSETFAALVDRLGRQGAFDAIMLLAYPAMTGVLQRAVDQQPPAGWNPARLPRIAEVGTPTGRRRRLRAPRRAAAATPRHLRRLVLSLPSAPRQELDPRAREIFDRVVGADRATTPRGPWA